MCFTFQMCLFQNVLFQRADDWQYERPSYQYYLGDMIYIEATVKQYFHVPLRVYVSECVATLSPESNSNPRYVFIENNG